MLDVIPETYLWAGFGLVTVVLCLTAAGLPGNAPPARERVRIINNVVVADNGALLRGENPRWDFWRRTDPDFWRKLRDEFRMNTVRVLCYQPPQNWAWDGKEGPGWDYDAASAEEMIPALDEWGDMAQREGFYVIIDYHPVGGHSEKMALKWWSVIAPRYADRTHVIYEVCNEPVAWHASQYTDEDIAFERNAYQFIRCLAPDTHIILWSFAKGDLNMVDVVDRAAEIDYANASVGWHYYNVNVDGVRWLNLEYPVIQTEIGANNTADYNKGAHHCEKLGISWIVLDGTSPHKPVDITWEPDPHFNRHAQ